MSRRKIILNLAISLDGYIADTDGEFDWIHGDGDKSHDTENQFKFPEFVNSIDTIVMGRKAFDDCGIESIEEFEKKSFLVATSKKLESKHNNVKAISGDIGSHILKLKEEEGKDIWLFGGAGSADSFIKANVVDKYIIGIIPTILGKGRPLFLENNPTIELHLDECTVTDGIAMLIYSKR